MIIPYWHKRIKRKSSETDYEVEVPPIKGLEFQSETPYVCPSCNTKLNLYKIFSIKIEGCPKCKGIFLDKDELRSLKDKSTKGSWLTLRWMDDEVEALEQAKAMPSRRPCPKCSNVNLISTVFGNSKIILDWCPSCHGLWLDREELQEILQHMADKLNNLGFPIYHCIS